MNKLFGASILVLGMAVSSAYANDVDVIADNEVNLASKSDSLNDAKGDGAANASGEESIAIEDSLNKDVDVDVKKTEIDTDIKTDDSFNSDSSKKPDDSFNNASGEDSANASGDDSIAINDSLNKEVDVDVKKTDIDLDVKTETTTKDSYNSKDLDVSLSKEETKIDASKEQKISKEDSFNNASGDASANASGDDSESHLYSDNKTEISTKDSFNKETDVKTEISNKDSYNTAKLDVESNKDSHDIDKSNKDSFNNKDSHDIDNSTKDSHDVTTKDSFNKETENKDSYNTEVTNKDSFNDESKHLTVGDVTLTFENNAAIATAELKNVSIGNKVENSAAFGSKARVEATAVVGDGSVSGWAGLNQMNVTAGNNNSSQMSQQVTANIRNLEVH